MHLWILQDVCMALATSHRQTHLILLPIIHFTYEKLTTFLLQVDGLYSLNLPIKILCCDTTDSAILDLAVSYHLPRFVAAHEIVHLSVVASTAAKKYIFCRKVFRNTRNSVKIETLRHLILCLNVQYL